MPSQGDARARAAHAPEQLRTLDPACAYIVRSTQVDELDIDAFDVIKCEDFTLLWPIIS